MTGGSIKYLFNCVAHKCNGEDYDVNDPKTHVSAPQSTGTICNVSNSDCLSTVQNVMSCQSAPGQVGCTGVGEERNLSLNGNNPITQYRPNENMIINGTSRGHVFDDGFVVRWVAVDSIGNASIWTAGLGTNTNILYKWTNYFLGPSLFNDIGLQNKINVQCKLKSRSQGC
jgi:filamentous hemagglutinin